MKLTVSREGVTFEATDKEFLLSNPENRNALVELVKKLHSAAPRAIEDQDVSAARRLKEATAKE